MATFDWTFDQAFTDPNWKLDGNGVVRVTDEVATAHTLTLSIRATTSLLESTLRTLKPDQGKLNRVPNDDGGFATVGRANGDNEFVLDPPGTRKPLRQNGTFYVRRYEEDLISQEVREWDVTVEFVADANRTDSPSISESPASDEWGFTTRYGEIATKRVDWSVAGTGEEGVERFELTARLTFDEAHAFEAALARVGGTRIKTIPDAPNDALDDTSSDVNTLTIDTPDSQSVVSDGDYIVLSWESRRVTDAYQTVSFTIAAV